MRRFVLSILATFAIAGGVLAVPTAAHAAPIQWCGTSSFQFNSGGEFPTQYWASYVGQAYGGILGGTYRIWHETYYYGGDYAGARAVKCDAEGNYMSGISLTKTTTSSSTDALCGTTNFTVSGTNGDTHYAYIATRTTDGFKYRYWSKRFTSGMLMGWSVTAARCL